MGISARKRTEWLLTGIMVFVFISCIILPLSSFAATDLWVVVPGGDPYWTTPGNWSLGYEPGFTGGRDSAILELSPAATTDAVVILNSPNNNSYNHGASSFRMDGSLEHSLELQQSQGGMSSGGHFDVGYNGIAIYTQTGGDCSSSSSLWLGVNTGSNGTYNLSGDTSTLLMADGNETIGVRGTGTFNQTGGYNRSQSDPITLGQSAGSIGTYNLSGDISTSKVVSDQEVIGGGGTGTFNQTGGSNLIGRGVFPNLIIGYGEGSSGTYNLSGGALNVCYTEVIGNLGSGTFNQSGGTHTLGGIGEGGKLTISANPGISSGTYNLSGGTLTLENGYLPGTIINNGQFNYSGGTLNANITNNGATTLSGFGIRTVNGDVTNNGTVKVTNTIAQYTGTFTNNGAYISDPTISIFNNLIVGQDGYLQGNRYDLFIISGYLENYSTNPLWNTSDSLLGFTGAGLHNIYDTNDVHWGSLAIYDGLLSLAGTGNLYVENLFGLTFDQTGAISNIWGNGLNIYYDVAYNPWFHGRTYSLMGGGSLLAYNTQAPVPEPSTMLLLGVGLLGLAGFRKKLKR